MAAAAKQAAALEPAVEEPRPSRVLRALARPPRSRLRDEIMRVSTDPQPLPDPFGDTSTKIDPTVDSLEEPTMPQERGRRESQPSELPPPVEPMEDTAPALPFREPSFDEPLPPGDLSQGLSTPGAILSCEEYQSECRRVGHEMDKRDITSVFVGLAIEGVANDDYPCECPLEGGTYNGRHYGPTTFTWKATGVCHKPLYFEDVQLERYGHSWNPVVQPFLSAGHFFISVPLLPYKMGLTPPNECMYTLGYYRPGSCAPYVIEPLQLSLRGALFEAGAATGFAFWFWP
jgi:hypothetical protein